MLRLLLFLRLSKEYFQMIWKSKQPVSFYEMYIPSLRIERVTKRILWAKSRPPFHVLY